MKLVAFNHAVGQWALEGRTRVGALPRLALSGTAMAMLLMVLVWRAGLWFTQPFPWDFAINWTAATGVRLGASPYDGSAMRELGARLADPLLMHSFADTFGSYIGAPTTAVMHLPFTFMPFGVSAVAFRIVSLAAWVAAVWLASAVAPAGGRGRTVVFGVGALLLLEGVDTSLRLGQVDAFIVLAVVVGIRAQLAGQCLLAGMSLGIAALVKVTPGLALVPLLRRGGGGQRPLGGAQ